MQGARAILEILGVHGYEAYIVGGAVRDLLMGKEPHDFDIATNAKPDEVMAIASQEHIVCTNPVGKHFGIVALVIGNKSYEVATFRSERYGADAHRPEHISYAHTLEEDVQRRDFTVNGMAMDIHGAIYDFVGGRADLEKSCIRTIGNAQERFREDGLRMFRACRFAAQLGFSLTDECQAGIRDSRQRVEGLSHSRIIVELEKILLAPFAGKGLDAFVRLGLADCSCSLWENGKLQPQPILPELSHLVGLPQMKQYHKHDGWNHTLVVVDASPAELALRWAALLHDVAKGTEGVRAEKNGKLTDHGHDMRGAEMAEAILRRWGYKSAFIKRVTWLIKSHMRFHFFVNHHEADRKKWLRKEAVSKNFRDQRELKEAFQQLTDVCVADVIGCGINPDGVQKAIDFGSHMQGLANDMPVHTKDLNYERALIQLCSEHTGEVLQDLLRRVQNGQVRNEAAELLHAAQKKLERSKGREHAGKKANN